MRLFWALALVALVTAVATTVGTLAPATGAPPSELRHPLQVRIMGSAPPEHLASGEDSALPLHVVAPPRSLSRRTDDEPTRARDLRECSERTTGWYLWVNGRRSCDDEQGARDPEPIEAHQCVRPLEPQQLPLSPASAPIEGRAVTAAGRAATERHAAAKRAGFLY